MWRGRADEVISKETSGEKRTCEKSWGEKMTEEKGIEGSIKEENRT